MMANVFRVFLRDVRRMAKVPPTWLVVLFLIVLPSLYTWFNVVGFWNPYENTGNLRVCVVNEDEGASSDLLGSLDLGSLIVESVSENDQLGWEFTDRAQAMEQLESGQAYAAFVIPSDFSADVATIATGSFTQPSLEYYVNEKTGPVSPKITDTGASTLDNTINDTFVSTVSSTVAAALNERLNGAREEFDQVRGSASARLLTVEGSVGESRAAIADLAERASAAAADASAAKSSMAQVKADVAALSEALRDASALTGEVNAELADFTVAAGSVFDQSSALISKTSAEASLAVVQAASSITAASGDVDAAIERGKAAVQEGENVAAQLRELQKSLPDGPEKDALGSMIGIIDGHNASAAQMLNGLETLYADTSAAADKTAVAASSVDKAVQATLGNIDEYRSVLSSETVPALSSAMTTIGVSAGDLSLSVGGQIVLADQAASVLQQLSSTLAASSSALWETDGILAEAAADLETVRTDLAALGSSDALFTVFGEEGVDAGKVADFMFSPTQVETEELYPLNAYGSAMAPLFINLTLWIGVLMLMVIMRIEVDDEGIANLTAAQRFVGRWLLLAVVAALQAVVCCAGCLLLGVQTASAAAFVATGIVASLSYLSIQYALSSTLQHVGKGICIVLVFVQIPAATGLYPVEMTTGFFQAIYPLFPFTYGINAMRETISGFYGTAWLQYLGVLLAFGAAFFAAGMAARPYLANLNRLFAKQIEESDIVNGEQVQLPRQRYRVAQLVKVLSDRDEFRSSVERSAQRFMNLYPRLKRGALVAGVAVPVALTALLAVLSVEKVVTLTVWLVWFVVIISFLVVIEYVRDGMERRVSLDGMTDDQVRTLFVGRDAGADAQGGDLR